MLSLKEFGQVKPIVIWRFMIIAGHGICEAAGFLGWQEILAVRLPDEWDELQARAYLIADNELASLAKVDTPQLASLLEEQQQAGRNLALFASSEEQLQKLLGKAASVFALSANMGMKVDRCPTCGQIYRIADHPEIRKEHTAS